MRINLVNLGLDEFFDRKSDIIYVLFSALTDMGHSTSISHNHVEGSTLNIIIGSDIICGEPNALNSLLDSGADFAIFEVENFNGRTINYRKKFDLSGYTALLEKSKFCFTPYLYNMSQLSSIMGSEKVAYTKWGFHDSMICNRVDRNGNYFYETFFYGLIKATRVAKIDALKNKFGKQFAVIDQTHPFTIRDYYISKSKVGLSLSYGDIDNFVNPFRLYHMAANGMPVLSDHSEDADGYLHLCNNFEFDAMIEEIEVFQPDEKILSDICRSEKLIENLRACF
ncbi:hypothetical protein [Candidatus Ponderosibacter sp. Uisw_141_02]|uniref:hypothetical protein n=1 Tax=Candidatus Ponderosibacter sp. Uisw_141_02 TaxID=3231000 RepID=UPI003D5BF475